MSTSYRSFGRRGSQYDFSNFDIGNLRERAQTLEDQQQGMQKKVNNQAVNLADTSVYYMHGQFALGI